MSNTDHPRIFLIGFNKCGTTSFHDYFTANGIASVHWRANTLAMALHRNRAEGRPLLEGIDRWTAYTDINCIPGSPWGRSNSDHAPLIEGVDVPDHRLAEDAVLIKGDQGTEGFGA